VCDAAVSARRWQNTFGLLSRLIRCFRPWIVQVKKVFVIFNPKAGKKDQADEVRAALASHFTPPRWALEIYETTGEEDVAAICRAACERGASLVIAAGGDGTLVGVANGLVHSPVPLGILPLGTGNDLARALLIPLKLDEAVELLIGDQAVLEVDALQVGERHFFSNVSVGITSEMIDGTKSADKNSLAVWPTSSRWSNGRASFGCIGIR